MAEGQGRPEQVVVDKTILNALKRGGGVRAWVGGVGVGVYESEDAADRALSPVEIVTPCRPEP